MSFRGLIESKDRDDLLAGWDPRLKLVLVLAALLMGVTSTKLSVTAMLFFLALGTLIITGRNVSRVLVKLLPVAVLALVVMITQAFLVAGTPWVTVDLGLWQVTAHHEGVAQGLLMAGHMLAGAALMVFIMETTSFSQIIFALAWFKLPKGLIEIITIAHRYLFVFGEEIDRVRKAQRMRLGYRNWRLAWKSAGILGGMVILRAFDKSERLYKSMCSRGYQGQIQVSYDNALAKRDLAPTLLAGIVLLGVFSIGF
ncbi:MAG: cobalt ECF transporter T component CbiQ [Thermincolia bacterium]